VSRRGPGRRVRRRRWIIFWVLTVVSLLAGVGGVVAVHLTGGAYRVPSASMENTLRPGDVLITAHISQVHRGDVIVERQQVPAPGNFVRRVIGLPGDHVVCCDARGRITVNGKPLDETYVYPGNAASATRFNVTVPPGHLWLMGDHRLVAYDSRQLGPLAVQVLGRVVLVGRSDRSFLLHTPRTFIADGLAPAREGMTPVLIGVTVALVAWPLLIFLVIVGVVGFIVGRVRRARRRGAPASAGYQPVPPPAGAP
jgi:signal peptidase I